MELGTCLELQGLFVTKQGSVHGRFQPFHCGHLEYLLAAAGRCDFLWIGITQPGVPTLVRDDKQPPHRQQAMGNPWTFAERASIVDAAARGAGLDPERFGIVPFPIESPERLAEFVPTTAIAYTTVLDEWNELKIEILRRQGYVVEVLWRRSRKRFSGGRIRQLIAAGDARWRLMVPPAAAQMIDDIGLPAILVER